jgi:glutamine amidotransferase
VIVGIVDYGMGNLLSVYNAVEMTGGNASLCTHPEDLKAVDYVILPGVGAFRDCIANLRKQGFAQALEEAAFEDGKPTLGICLGMQAMARRSFEGGVYEGLGWFEADVHVLQPSDPTFKVPHVGWNEVVCRPDFMLFEGLPPRPDLYFVHSYSMRCDDELSVAATCDHGGAVTAAVCRDTIVATQFHPEKSQDHGLRILENFLKWKP